MDKRRKHSLYSCNVLAKEHGGKCLSETYVDFTAKMRWVCKFGHLWDASLKSICKGSWCPLCAGNRKHTIEDCHECARIKGGFCLSDAYIDQLVPMTWKCHEGHVWTAIFKSIRRGHWCPYCVGQIKHTITDANVLAALHGGKCLSTKYSNGTTKLRWECAFGHAFDMDYSHVQQGSWCRKCFDARNALHRTKTLTDCSILALARKGTCTSATYADCFSPLSWECEFDHKFELSYFSVQQGSWCPECSGKESSPQRRIREILEAILPGKTIHTNYRGFYWLRSFGTSRQEIDIFVEELKLGIEYDGEQHFKPVDFFGGEEKLDITRARDKMKDDKISQHKEDVRFFIRFNYTEDLTEEYVAGRLKSVGAIL